MELRGLAEHEWGRLRSDGGDGDGDGDDTRCTADAAAAISSVCGTGIKGGSWRVGGFLFPCRRVSGKFCTVLVTSHHTVSVKRMQLIGPVKKSTCCDAVTEH